MILTRYILTNLVPQHFDSYVLCMPSCYFLTAWCTLGLKNGRNFFPEFLRKPTLFHSKWKKPLYVWDYCVQGGGSWKAKNVNDLKSVPTFAFPAWHRKCIKLLVIILLPSSLLSPLSSSSSLSSSSPRLFSLFPPLPSPFSPLPSPAIQKRIKNFRLLYTILNSSQMIAFIARNT